MQGWLWWALTLIGMVERREKAVLSAVFTAVERLLVEGDPDVREATVVGLLEDLQNLNLHPNGTAPEQFLPYLGLASAPGVGETRSILAARGIAHRRRRGSTGRRAG